MIHSIGDEILLLYGEEIQLFNTSQQLLAYGFFCSLALLERKFCCQRQYNSINNQSYS